MFSKSGRRHCGDIYLDIDESAEFGCGVQPHLIRVYVALVIGLNIHCNRIIYLYVSMNLSVVSFKVIEIYTFLIGNDKSSLLRTPHF